MVFTCLKVEPLLSMSLCQLTRNACQKFKQGELTLDLFLAIVKRVSRICQKKYNTSISKQDVLSWKKEFGLSRLVYKRLLCEVVHLNKIHPLLRLLDFVLKKVMDGESAESTVGEFEEDYKKRYLLHGTFWANFILFQKTCDAIIAGKCPWLYHAWNCISKEIFYHMVVDFIYWLLRRQ